MICSRYEGGCMLFGMFFGGHMWNNNHPYGYGGYGPSTGMWISMIVMQVIMIVVVSLVVIALIKYIKKH